MSKSTNIFDYITKEEWESAGARGKTKPSPDARSINKHQAIVSTFARMMHPTIRKSCYRVGRLLRHEVLDAVGALIETSDDDDCEVKTILAQAGIVTTPRNMAALFLLDNVNLALRVHDIGTTAKLFENVFRLVNNKIQSFLQFEAALGKAWFSNSTSMDFNKLHDSWSEYAVTMAWCAFIAGLPMEDDAVAQYISNDLFNYDVHINILENGSSYARLCYVWYKDNIISHVEGREPIVSGTIWDHRNKNFGICLNVMKDESLSHKESRELILTFIKTTTLNGVFLADVDVYKQHRAIWLPYCRCRIEYFTQCFASKSVSNAEIMAFAKEREVIESEFGGLKEHFVTHLFKTYRFAHENGVQDATRQSIEESIAAYCVEHSIDRSALTKDMLRTVIMSTILL